MDLRLGGGAGCLGVDALTEKEELRIKETLAEFMEVGKAENAQEDVVGVWWYDKQHNIVRWPPDYPNSLDLMAGVESKLSLDKPIWDRYCGLLNLGEFDCELGIWFAGMLATALQRARAAVAVLEASDG